MNQRHGLLVTFAAYFFWGLFPLYWKQLNHLPPSEILAHRMVWSLFFLVVLLAWRKEWAWIGRTWRDKRTLLAYLAAAMLLSLNWGLYIWGVNHDHIVETSLGYFINPLLSVALGVVVLKERLRRGQWVAIGLAFLGVAWLTWVFGRLPYIALSLAGSFALYGLIKKTAKLPSLQGLSLETALMFFPALLYLLWRQKNGIGAWAQSDLHTSLFLLGSGVVTAVPLLLFGMGARQIPLSVVGILQFITPTMQFLLGVFWYLEPFTQTKLVGFLLIWLGLLVFSADALSEKKLRKAT